MYQNYFRDQPLNYRLTRLLKLIILFKADVVFVGMVISGIRIKLIHEASGLLLLFALTH